MRTYQSEEVKEAFNGDMDSYETYIAGYHLYKQFKKKWGTGEKEVASDALQ